MTVDPGNVHQGLRLSHLQFEARAFGDADATLVAAERDHPGHEALRHHRSHFQTLRPVFEAWEPWPASDDPNSDWHAKHQQLCRNLRSVRPRLLFIGDSITAELEEKAQSVWERHFLPLRAAQIGIPADRTQNVLWRLENGAARGVSPEVVVLLIGTNNLFHNDDAGVVRGISAVIDRLRASLPQSRLLVLGILPREAAPDAPLRGRIASIPATEKRKCPYPPFQRAYPGYIGTADGPADQARPQPTVVAADEMVPAQAGGVAFARAVRGGGGGARGQQHANHSSIVMRSSNSPALTTRVAP